MAEIIHIEGNDETMRRIASAAFPEYSGRKFKIMVSDSPINCASYWDGGSRDYFRFLNLETMQVSAVVPAQSAFDKPIQGIDNVTLPLGFACVEHSIFCGKDAGITVHIRPENAAKFLPEPQAVTLNEEIVLQYTRALKNTYQGVSNYRFIEANRDMGIPASEWESAKSALISRGLLDARGAITVAGRNIKTRGDWELRKAYKGN